MAAFRHRAQYMHKSEHTYRYTFGQMKITSIIENTSNIGLPIEHGLSLFIQLENEKNVLFDMGQSSLFAENASRLGLCIADVDTAIISHGHYDHGGGLGTFLSLNEKANVYIHKDAFMPHYSLRQDLRQTLQQSSGQGVHEPGLRYIGIDKELQADKRIVSCGSITHVSDEMTLFADVQGICCCPQGNRLLFGPKPEDNDSFSHEQNLIIEEGSNIVLFAGCAHKGIINILRKTEEVIGRKPTHVLAGMHLVKSGLDEEAESSFIHTLANELATYKQTMFYTMHCTGEQQFLKLKEIMSGQIEYLSCGDSIVI